MRAEIFLLTTLFLAGCCREARPTSIADSTEALLAALRAPGLALPTSRGELRVDHLGPQGRISGKVYAFTAGGGRLRLEAVSPLDTTLRTVAVDGETFSLIDQENGRCLQGQAQPCLVGEAVGLELSADHVAAALLGAVPLIRQRAASSRWDRCGFYVVELEGEEAGWRETIHLETRQGRLVPTEATVVGPAGTALEVSFEQYEALGDRLVPRALRLSMPLSGSDLSVEWRALEVGVSLPERAWQILCPAGFAREQATCTPRGALPAFEPPGGEEVSASPPGDGGLGEGDAGPLGGDGGPGDGGPADTDGGGGDTDLSEELGI